MRRRRSAASVVGDVLLTIAAAAGAVCIALVVAAVAFDVSIMLFKTGSMSPSIPAGSAALVREVPAASVDVGDVVTVDRPGKLPVTHRVVAISGSGAERELTLRGDANPVDDPMPYRVSTVRIVLFAVPGIATVIAALGNPLVLGGLTLGATALVVWAFWPRTGGGGNDNGGGRHREPQPARPRVAAANGEHEQHARGAATTALSAATIAAAASFCLLTPAAHAEAATAETVVQGEVIRLTSIGDAAAMASLGAGESAVWIVGVQAEAPSPGVIRMSLAAEGAANPVLEVTVTACDHRTVDGHCTDELVLVTSTALAARHTFDLGTMSDTEQRWLRVETRLSALGTELPVESEFTVTADGFGESVGTDGGGAIAASGIDLAPWLAVAAASVVAGVATALVVAARRRGAA
ncbi:signal peptidase I [Agromyces sp. CCNWLW203]|uniref:signal peptidase I n=1 Tax=Agromyces sp. CCNWLW203 TaxID=3112842 RepID=UPI002F96991C